MQRGAFHVRIAVGTVIRVSNKCYVNVNRESDRPVEQWGRSGLSRPEQKEWPSKVINSGPGCESVCTGPSNTDNISEDVAVASSLVLIKITQTNVKICRN